MGAFLFLLVLSSQNVSAIEVTTSDLSGAFSKFFKPIVTQREGNTVEMNINGVTSTATCATDEVVVGGGYRSDDNFNIRSEECN